MGVPVVQRLRIRNGIVETLFHQGKRSESAGYVWRFLDCTENGLWTARKNSPTPASYHIEEKEEHNRKSRALDSNPEPGLMNRTAVRFTDGDKLGKSLSAIDCTTQSMAKKHYSSLAKKDLGAFYTPMPYAQKAVELVQKAVERVPDGNDYIILENIRPKMAQLNASRMCA